MTKKTVSIDIPPALPEDGNEEMTEEEIITPRRVIQRLDPQGPFFGEMTRDRARSMQSNVEMEDVSGDSRIANAPSLPKHPIYNGSTTKDKREFIQKYNLYYNTLLSYETTYNKPFIMPVSSCIDPWVKDLVARFEFKRPVAQISNDDWIEYFKKSLQVEKLDLKAMDVEMAKLSVDLGLPDAQSMMTSLVCKIYRKMEDQGAVDYVERVDMKRIVHWMVEALKPQAFKSRIEAELKLEVNKNLRKDPVAAREWIAQDLKLFLQYNPDEIGKQKKQETKIEPKKVSKPDAKRPVRPVPVGEPPGRTGQSDHRSNLPRGACLKCGSRQHSVRQCSQVKEGEVEKLIQEYRDNKERETGGRRVQRVRGPSSPKNDPSQMVSAKLEGCLETDLLLDTGADVSLMSRGLLEKLELEAEFLKVKKLLQPVKIGTAGKECIYAHRKILLESVVLQTSAGPLSWRNVECFVNEADDDTLCIISNGEMEKMGYSVDALLVAAKRRLEEKKGSEDAFEVSNPADENSGPFVRLLEQNQASLYTADDAEEEDELEEEMLTPICYGIEDQAAKIESILNQKVGEAVESGLSAEGVERLRKMLHTYWDVFRMEFADDPPLSVPPMEVKMPEAATPVMCRSSRYSPIHHKYFEEHMAELERRGLVYKNPESRWGSAPRVVSKKDGSLRMTVDLRAVNDRTIPRAWPMPHQEAEMADLEGATCFFDVDGFKQYWQEPLAKTSREYLSIVTPNGIYTPTRVLMGATDAVAYTQQTMETIMAPVLNNGVKVWLDDVLGYARNEEELLDRLEQVLKRCAQFGLKLHPEKCNFFKKSVKWCGRVISASGMTHCPIRIEGLVAMELPTTAAELQQFMCACNWMRASIPRYNELVHELSKLLEVCMSKCGSRKKTKLDKVELKDLGWTKVHEEAIAGLKKALVDMIPMAHPNDESDVCVYTDASQDHWGAIITQVKPGALSKPLEDQEHEPLAFLSGSFKGSSSRWPIVEKEAFAIVETCKRMEYLLLRERGFHLFTDHRNLKYIFDPKSVNGNIARYQADKLQRWSMVLQMFRYQIEHISGESNVWGDLLSRWGAKKDIQELKSVKRLVAIDRISPLQEEDFKWPSFAEISEAQNLYKLNNEGFKMDLKTKCWKDGKGRMVIPETANDLKCRLCVIAHAGSAGHRGMNATVSSLKDVFWWKGVRCRCLFLLCCYGPAQLFKPHRRFFLYVGTR